MKPEDIDILLLFNLTDYAAKPWLEKGFTVLAVDTQHHSKLSEVEGDKGWYWRTNVPVERLRDEFPGLAPVLVLAFPPCTDLAVSGAKHFEKKRLANPEFQAEAVALAKVASTFDCPYMIENPVSVLSTLWRKPDYIFHPWEYGGYLKEHEKEHPDYPDYIAPYDAYPKKTCLWVGNGFIMPEKRPVEPEVGYSRQHRNLGGKSIRTKNIRSATPRGFMVAVQEANEDLVIGLLTGRRLLVNSYEEKGQHEFFSLASYMKGLVKLVLTRIFAN